MSLKHKIILLSSLLTLMIFIEGTILSNNNSNIFERAEQIGKVEMPLLNNAHKLKLAVVQVQQWLTDISATRGLDGLNDGFTEAEKNAQLFQSIIAEIKSLDPENTSSYDAMTKDFNSYYQAGKTMAQAYIQNGPAGGNLTMEQFDKAAQSINERIDTFLSNIENQVNQALAQQRQTVTHSGYYVIGGSITIIILLLIISFIITQAVANLPKIVAKMASVDLTGDYQISGNDEVSQIMQSLNGMRSTLKNMIANISNTTGDLTNASTKLANLSSITRENTDVQFSETEQVATAMNEMTATVQEVALNITLAANEAKTASIETNKGYQVVNDAINEINELAGQIDNASKIIHQLEKDTSNITSVLDVIKGVADQTNLLALNAAIEAARAGEQGRGFAVVADEVRTLASRTQKATEEINGMIEKLLTGSRQAVEGMNKSSGQAKSAVDKASKTGQSLSSILNVVNKINDMNAQIATAAEEQSVVADEINRNILRINDMSHNITNNVEEVSAASRDMQNMSNQLKNIVEQFST